MSETWRFLLITYVGLVIYRLLGVIVLYFSARCEIRRAFAAKGATVTRIHAFKGFLDLWSVRAALTHTGYLATVVAPDGRVTEEFCLVRYLPLVWLARSMEVWPYESDAA